MKTGTAAQLCLAPPTRADSLMPLAKFLTGKIVV